MRRQDHHVRVGMIDQSLSSFRCLRIADDNRVRLDFGGRSGDRDMCRPFDRMDMIARHPGRRAADLADQLGWLTPRLKRHVRRLKQLGLTESLDKGYRLSPRGRALLDALKKTGPRRAKRNIDGAVGKLD